MLCAPGAITRLESDEAWEADVPDDIERIDLVDADAPPDADAEANCEVVGDCGPMLPATESRRPLEYREPVDDARESLEARRERAAEMNMRVSCSVTGDGPGTGGKGAEGGSDKGGLGDGSGLLGVGVPDGVSGKPDSGVPRGVLGICEGGTGKEDRRRGTSFRRSEMRDDIDSVVVEVAIARAANDWEGLQETGGARERV